MQYDMKTIQRTLRVSYNVYKGQGRIFVVSSWNENKEK